MYNHIKLRRGEAFWNLYYRAEGTSGDANFNVSCCAHCGKELSFLDLKTKHFSSAETGNICCSEDCVKEDVKNYVEVES